MEGSSSSSSSSSSSCSSRSGSSRHSDRWRMGDKDGRRSVVCNSGSGSSSGK